MRQAHLAALGSPARVNSSPSGHGAFLVDSAWRARIVADIRLTVEEGSAAAAAAARTSGCAPCGSPSRRVWQPWPRHLRRHKVASLAAPGLAHCERVWRPRPLRRQWQQLASHHPSLPYPRLHTVMKPAGCQSALALADADADGRGCGRQQRPWRRWASKADSAGRQSLAQK